jgi:hypothetical protein
MKNNDAIKKWLEGLNEEERNQVELLDSYFTFRQNLPGEYLIEDDKTTSDIQDELSEMMSLDQNIIFTYMRKHNFGLKTQKDGTVKWAIWRNPV